MKSTLEQLSAKEKEALARLYGTDGYEALKKVHTLEVAGLGADALGSQSIEDTKFLQGRAYQSKASIQLIRDVHKQVNKEG